MPAGHDSPVTSLHVASRPRWLLEGRESDIYMTEGLCIYLGAEASTVPTEAQVYVCFENAGRGLERTRRQWLQLLPSRRRSRSRRRSWPRVSRSPRGREAPPTSARSRLSARPGKPSERNPSARRRHALPLGNTALTQMAFRRHRLTAVEKSDYLKATLCIMKTPAKLGIPAAKTRWDELQYIHVYQTPHVHVSS